jgi:hypothetical protein
MQSAIGKPGYTKRSFSHSIAITDVMKDMAADRNGCWHLCDWVSASRHYESGGETTSWRKWYTHICRMRLSMCWTGTVARVEWKEDQEEVGSV